jgi:penicillin G amidase
MVEQSTIVPHRQGCSHDRWANPLTGSSQTGSSGVGAAKFPSVQQIAVDGRRITIKRDAFGIPHISASTLGHLIFGQGYATAGDRLWHIECDRRRALGTLAAVTGQPNDVVADSFARRARVAEASLRGFAALSGPARAMCTAHTAGMNARLAEQAPLSAPFTRIGAPRPEMFEPWHCVAIFVIRHLNFATWQSKLWNARVAVALGAEAMAHFNRAAGPVPVIVPPGLVSTMSRLPTPDASQLAALEPLGLATNGSNAWAVPGPIVAGDPHRSLEAPNVYYQIGLSCPADGIDAVGFSFPGVPGIPHFGQTAHVAWGVTNAMADYQDLFIEQLPSALVDVRSERVEARGGAGIDVECGMTRRGPVVVGGSEHGVGLALRSTGLDAPGGSFDCFVPMLRARSTKELDLLLDEWVEPVNNVVMADTSGTIAYRTAGRVPVRSGASAWLPVGDGEWSGTLANGDLPRHLGTEPVVTANQQITTDSYPYVIGINPAPPYRASRIWANIERNPAAVHVDAVSLPGRRFAEVAGGSLGGWDGDMQTASREAALFALAEAELVRELTSRLPSDLLANPFASFEPPATALSAAMHVGKAVHSWIESDNRWLLRVGETWTILCAASLAVADAQLGDRTWGDVHHLQPLRLGEAERLDLSPVSGANDCVMATSHVPGSTTHAVIGSTCRYVWNVKDRLKSGWVVPLGVSENDDFSQLGLYVAGELVAAFLPE